MRRTEGECIYKRIAPSWVPAPYWAFWLLVGLLAAGVGELVLALTGEPCFPVTAGVFGLLLGVLPTWFVWLQTAFETTISQFADIVSTPEGDLETWKRHQVASLFTFSTPLSRVVPLVVVAGGVASVLILGIPFQSALLDTGAVIAFVPILVLCGHAAFILARLTAAVWSLMNLPPDIPFYWQRHPAVAGFRKFLLQVALTGTAWYGFLVLAIWRGPYGIPPSLQVWLYVIALYPMVWVLVSLVGIRRFMSTAQIASVSAVNVLVQQALLDYSEAPSREAAEKLHSLMRCQSLIESGGSRSPPSLGVIASVLVALLTAATQVIVTLLQSMPE